LPHPDVHGVDTGRATLEQAIGEAAPRSTHVKAHRAFDRDAKRLERMGQLHSATTDIRMIGFGDFDSGVAGIRRAGFGGGLAFDPHLARENQGLGARARLDHLAFDEQLIEPAFP